MRGLRKNITLYNCWPCTPCFQGSLLDCNKENLTEQTRFCSIQDSSLYLFHPINSLTRLMSQRWIVMTEMFVCIVETWFDCWARGFRHAVIQIMREWSQKEDNQTCVCCACEQKYASTGGETVANASVRCQDWQILMATASSKSTYHNECMQGDTEAPVLKFTSMISHM